MHLHSNTEPRDAHAQLVLQLCEALSNFVAATASENGFSHEHEPDRAANDDYGPQLTTLGYDDIISLQGILVEYGLTQPQVLKLRKGGGFPEPIGPTRPLVFRRHEVERWVGSQRSANSPTIMHPRLTRISWRDK
jgi:hypothetical protein